MAAEKVCERSWPASDHRRYNSSAREHGRATPVAMAMKVELVYCTCVPFREAAMKHHATGRPIGKCKGCCLNFRRVCAAGVDPKEQWSGGRCASYDDRELLDQCLNPAPVTGAKAAKLKRRARAIAADTMPHFDGQVFVPARTAGRAAGLGVGACR